MYHRRVTAGISLSVVVCLICGCDSDKKKRKISQPLPPPVAVPTIEVDPLILDFGGVPVLGSKAGTVTIRNAGTGDLVLTSVALDAATDPAYALTGFPPTFTLPAGADTQVEVACSPTAMGAALGTLRIASNDANQPNVAVELRGTGVPDAAWEIALGQCRDVDLAAATVGPNQYWVSVPAGALVPARCQVLALRVENPVPADAEILLEVSYNAPVPHPAPGDWSGTGEVTIGAAELAAGIYYVVVENPGDEPVSFELCARLLDKGVPFRRGYVDDNDIINMADAIFLLMYLFLDGQTPPCLAAADTNAYRSLSVSDAVRILHHLFNNGGPLPEPFLDCGCDPSPSPFSCDSFPLCEP